ncbi:Succinyl-CoA:(R)-benzylsuccinate CoA-transferase subunit BbsE [Desulfuromonas sp. DDH964]|uniref:CaiB/BaiF CoA transferase family protein n=1 Tax=Desulfuromonas sp. DDH964 TaxID=1823759 RepID=UPI00078CB281|nr:CoA transferase [Desulfuromonas sp. DDH964]AMV70441.1 Succinyl-CoA:(R)-benzylsuccinate CoA-transferase subunit BbsE [Desulfuromonas sp. DDH964]
MLDDALRGCRVLDLSQYLPGPYATRLLADLGAEVVKIEPPAGDPMRTFICRDDDGISPLYKQVNAGKIVVFLDLKSGGGQAAFAELVTAADVLLESFRPGVLERLGFGRERLAEFNPRLIHCALSGFGQDGPASQRAGHDLTYMALSGMLHSTGTVQTPVIPFPPVSDYAGGEKAAAMILAALLKRQRTGAGCFLDTSLFETVLAWQSFGQAAAQQAGPDLGRGRGLITGGAACYQIYPTADDRFVVLAALEAKFWHAFCCAVERPDWIDRQQEPLPQTALIAELRAFFASADRDAWVARLARVDCCFEPLLEPEEVLRQPQVVARHLLAPAVGNSLPADILLPLHVDGEPPRSRRPLVTVAAEDVAARWRTPFVPAPEVR